ncbi:cytochrome C oxidase subunit IV family protein [Paenibacillus eucommiae]|uniref:Cytochrome c oxidase subunit 4 n=1 Tax=Paenibacillus eucommiae TaxID=1355755 RepID=A0ABS4J014_9BACL|nr:cytochrome C oxidase subunit IV family protein [Paenibacillus eucommiae]MBP1992441.1 cytochrome c oxidase subunit 4 [Paenibacillus eucommiae]
MSSNTHEAAAPNKRIKHESPRNHYMSYIISILLTMLAFAVVLYGGLDRSFIMVFIVSLGFVQATIQLLFWMHAKERGHFLPLLFMVGGLIVAITGVIAALYLTWW